MLLSKNWKLILSIHLDRSTTGKQRKKKGMISFINITEVWNIYKINSYLNNNLKKKKLKSTIVSQAIWRSVRLIGTFYIGHVFSYDHAPIYTWKILHHADLFILSTTLEWIVKVLSLYRAWSHTFPSISSWVHISAISINKIII